MQKDLLRGQLPRRVHVHVVRHAVGHIPTTYVGLEKWVQQLWRDKEARLHQFYVDGVHFPPQNSQQALPRPTKTLQVKKAHEEIIRSSTATPFII